MEYLSTLVGFLLAVSLASERLIAILKTFVPWFAIDKTKDPENSSNSLCEKTRRLSIQGLALLAGWLTASFMTKDGFDPFGNVELFNIPAFIVGLLASGGSAFWNQLLGYTKAVRDIKKTVHQREEGLQQTAERKINTSRHTEIETKLNATETLQSGGQALLFDSVTAEELQSAKRLI